MTDEQTLKPRWRQVKFGDVVRLSKARSANPEAEGIERYVGLDHIDPEDLRIRRWGLVAEGTTFTTRFKPGQVLFGKRRAYQRKVAVADFEGVCSGDIYVFESADPSVLLPELLPFICQMDRFFEYAVGTSAGSLSPRTNWTSLANFYFGLPPIEEQNNICNLLRVLNRNLNHLYELELRLEQLRKAYLVEQFTNLLEDESSFLVKLTEAGDVQIGRQRSPKYDKGESPRPYLRVANVFDGFIDTTDVKQMDFSDQEFEHYKLERGDILLVEGHSSAQVVGRSAVYKGEVPNSCFQNTLLRFRPRKTSSAYAHHFFKFCLYTGRFSTVAKQTTIAHLSFSRFASMNFPIPTPEQEEQIIGDLLNIENSICNCRERKKKLEIMRRSLMKIIS